MEDDELVTMTDAAREAGVRIETMTRWAIAGGVIIFQYGDRRRRLIRRSDLERLKAPRPINQPESDRSNRPRDGTR